MSEVRFDESQYGRLLRAEPLPFMVGWVLRMGLVKDPTQARKLLFGLALALLALALVIFISQSHTSPPQDIPDPALSQNI